SSMSVKYSLPSISGAVPCRRASQTSGLSFEGPSIKAVSVRLFQFFNRSREIFFWMAIRRLRRSVTTSASTFPSNAKLPALSTSEYSKTPIQSNCPARTKSQSSLKSVSVSPGNPTMNDVRSETPGIVERMRSSNFRNASPCDPRFMRASMLRRGQNSWRQIVVEKHRWLRGQNAQFAMHSFQDAFHFAGSHDRVHFRHLSENLVAVAFDEASCNDKFFRRAEFLVLRHLEN